MKTIEQTNSINQKPKDAVFFTKKKIVFFTIGLIVFVIFIILVSKFFFDINFQVIANLLASSYQNNQLFFLWLFLLIIYPIYNCVYRISTFAYKLRKKKIFVEWYNWMLFCFITFFIGAITPFSVGYEPYVIYWLKRNGLSLKEATALVASFTVLNPSIQVIITWPSFFVLCSEYSAYAIDLKWIISFWSVFAGLMFDLMGTIFWISMSYSKNAHYWLNVIINWFKKIFKLKYKTNAEIRREYKENAIFKKLFVNELRDWKFVLITIFGSILWNVLYYCTIIFAFNLTSTDYVFNAAQLFNYTNVATTANNFIPIPGAEGTLQATLSIFIQASNQSVFPNQKILAEICNNSVFIWRAFTFYLTAILGVLAMLVLMVKETYKHIITRKKKHLKIDNKTFGIIVLIKDWNDDLLKDTLGSLMRNTYNHELIHINFVVNQKINHQQKALLDKNLTDIQYDVTYLKEWNNMFQIINILKQKQLLNQQYYNFINQGDYLDLDILVNVNGTLHTYDIYASRYKTRLINHTHYEMIDPFYFLYKKRLYHHEQFLTPFYSGISFFIKSDLLLNNLITYQGTDYKNLYFFDSILKITRSLRYLRKFSGYENTTIKYDPYALLTTMKLFSNDNAQELIYSKNIKYVAKLNEQLQILSLNRPFDFEWAPLIYRKILNKKYNRLFNLNSHH